MIPATLHTPPRNPPPFVGRERERGLLRERLDAALAGCGGTVLVGGEAGVGKSALVAALGREAADRGALILGGGCYDLTETPPYGPWRELFRRGAERARDVPALASIPPPGFADALGRDALVAEVRGAVAALAGQAPLVLALEDLQWADPASLELLRALAREAPTLPLLLLATYRADELSRRHPLALLLPVLEREAGAARLDLRRLPAAGVAALVAAHYPLADGDRDRLAAHLLDRAGGNPFFALQLLRALEEDGALRPLAGGWAVGDLERAPLPPSLRQVVDARLARLDEAGQGLLEAAAVIGQAVPFALWGAVVGRAEGELFAVAEAAARARLVEPTPDGAGIAFAHALVREALYEGLLPFRRREAHRRVGEALGALAGPDPDAVAQHFRQAGDPRAAEWLVRAGERAERAHAWRTAAERYEAALALAPAGDAGARPRAELLIRLATLGHFTDRRRAIARLEEAARLAAEAGDEALAAVAAFERGLLRCLVGERRGGLAELAAALAALEALPDAARAGLPALPSGEAAPGAGDHRGILIDQLARVGRLAEAGALAAGRAGRVPPALAAALGRPAEARRALAAGRAAREAAGPPARVGTALLLELAHVALPYEADRVAERRRLLAEAERAFARAGELQGRPERLPRHLGLALPLLEGRWAEARALALAALAGYEERRQEHPRGVLGALARARGEPEEAWRQVRAALPEGPALEPGDSDFLATLALQRLAAGLALDAGDLPTARVWLAAHERWLACGGAVLGRAEGQLGWAAYHRAAGDLVSAREHAERALAHAADPRQPPALLAAHRLLGELEIAAGRHAAAQRHLAESLRLAEACAAPYERARTLLALAELHLARGARADAGARLEEARALLGPLGARPALARADALGARLAGPSRAPVPAPAYPAGLSGREVEVLRLVAEGLTNPQVAARLFLSPRTVAHHLDSIYGKLAVPSRAAATRFAVERGLA